MVVFVTDYVGILWTNIEAYCPICKKTFKGWYCPSCGLPKKNSKYALWDSKSDFLPHCSKYHFRPEFLSFENFQLCDDCYTTNPFNAKYCRNCGKKISSTQGVDKNGYGWVDLGLSVLWSTKTLKGFFMWNGGNCYQRDEVKYKELEKKGMLGDSATLICGEKWRTPTKEEFEELMIECKWEKCLDPISEKHALKVIGPNGNSIIIPVTGAGSGGENEYSHCFLWTSSEATIRSRRYGFCFKFIGYEGFEKTLTPKERKEKEIEIKYGCRSGIATRLTGLIAYFDTWYGVDNSLPLQEQLQIVKKKEEEKRRKEAEERKILSNMGDDSKEREENRKKDMERRQKLWLETPVEFKYEEERFNKNTISIAPKYFGRAIRPVVDKKWQGNI